MSTEPNNEGAPAESPALWFHRRATHFVSSQMLYHLNELGVVGELVKGAATAEQLATRLGLDARRLAVVLDYVANVERLFSVDAAGSFELTEFGRAVVDRFGRVDAAGELRVNLFDVRVGAYGPVWFELDRLLRGAAYGTEVKRRGGKAAEGVFKIAQQLAPALCRQLEARGARAAVEVGVGSGMLELVADRLPAVARFGLDRSAHELEVARGRADGAGVEAGWLLGDALRPEAWAKGLAAAGPGVIFSLHLHELLAAGVDAVARALAALRGLLPGWSLVFFEQPRLTPADRTAAGEMLWLYAQSNVLIHHLIGNGQILSEGALLELFASAGCAVAAVEPTGYLGYKAFVLGL